MKPRCLLLLLALSAAVEGYAQKRVRYDLHIADTVVSYTGKPRKAIAANGQLPMPTLHFTEGDTAEVHVHNGMHHPTSIHWHGILLPNEYDGVPYLTTAPIEPHSTQLATFVLRQSGTYWYHSHTMLQEQAGMYGALIIHKRGEPVENEEVLLLSDWTNERPHEVERSLHHATDWYLVRKDAAQSYGEALVSGYFFTKLTNDWKRMTAMDVSDVYYDAFLANGKPTEVKPAYKAGDKVRLRVINGSAATYFWLTYAGGKMTVVASDGADVVPVEVDRLLIATSETFDVIVTLPDDGAYQFLATSEDRTGSASLWLGSGTEHAATPLPRLNYFEGMKMMNGMMTLGGNLRDMGMNMSLQQMDMNAVMYSEATDTIVTFSYAMLRSPHKTTLPDAPFRVLNFELTGNMNRYVWTINNKTVSESDRILIRKGENVRIIIKNSSMMRHPMHLHGHFFRVVNEHGDYSPMKNVMDIMPMETNTIEFNAAEEYGNWYFHCHILYHMMAGMGRIFTYEDSPVNPQIPYPDKALRMVYRDDRRFYLGAEVGLESNGSDGEVTLMNTRWEVAADWRLGISKEAGYEVEAHVGRYIGRKQFFMPYAGWDWRYSRGHRRETTLFGQSNTKGARNVACVGFRYILPLFVIADARLDHEGIVRIQLTKNDIPLTKRLRMWGMVNTDVEYSVGAKYLLTKYLAASTHYDSDMGWGIGVRLIY